MQNTRVLGSKYDIRPAPCRECKSPAWWNGKRTVAPIRKNADGEVVHEPETIRHRARCSSKDCPVGSWTVYEQSDYPHRLFQLDVVMSGLCMVLFGAATMTAAAKAHLCSRDSIRRWKHWLESLADPRDLERLCIRIDSEGLPPPVAPDPAERSARVILLVEHLVRLLARRGVKLRGQSSGLTRLLINQLERFGEVFYLTKSSPPLRADLTFLCL